MNELSWLYLATGLLLPLFYIPQIRKLLADHSELAAYSMSKAVAQLALRFIGMAYVILVNQDQNIIWVIAADVLGRSAELAVACGALRRQKRARLLADGEIQFVVAAPTERKLHRRVRNKHQTHQSQFRETLPSTLGKL